MKVLPKLAADFYAWDALAYVFGSSYHPGGLDLTGRLAGLMRIPRGARVLDVASGRGASARYLADWFEWRVVGVDVSSVNVARARRTADGGGTTFLAADGNLLPFREGTFDAAICECSLCLFGDETTAMREIVRAMKPGACVGISDVTLAADAPLSPAMRTALAAVACLATAKPVDEYRQILDAAGVHLERVEDASRFLGDLLESLRATVRRAESLGLEDVRVGPYAVPQVADLLDEAWDLRRDGYLGYALFIGRVIA